MPQGLGSDEGCSDSSSSVVGATLVALALLLVQHEVAFLPTFDLLLPLINAPPPRPSLVVPPGVATGNPLLKPPNAKACREVLIAPPRALAFSPSRRQPPVPPPRQVEPEADVRRLPDGLGCSSVVVHGIDAIARRPRYSAAKVLFAVSTQEQRTWAWVFASETRKEGEGPARAPPGRLPHDSPEPPQQHPTVD